MLHTMLLKTLTLIATIWLTGLLLGLSVWSFAQVPPVRFERLSVKDGLPSNNVRAIIQNRQGYLWIGTYAGISRFDGYSFKTYSFNPQDTTTIGGNHVIGLWEDPTGFIWAAISGGGLTRLDPRTDKARRFMADPHRPHWLRTNAVTAIRGDHRGNLWVGTTEGLFHFDPKTERFTAYSLNPEGKPGIGQMITAIHEDCTGTVWIGAMNGGISRVNVKQSGMDGSPRFTFTHFRHNPADPGSLDGNQVMALAEDHSGALWVGTYAGLDRFDTQTGRCTAHFAHKPADSTSISSNRINRFSIAEDKQGNLWVGTMNGLNRLNPERSRFTRFPYNPRNPNSPAAHAIHSIYTDRTGIVWVGTNDAGLCRFDPNRRAIPFFSQQPGSPVTLNGNNIRSICGDTLGYLWIGTEGGGLFRYQRKSGQLTNYRATSGRETTAKGQSGSDGLTWPRLTTNFIGGLLNDSEGQIWIGPGSDWTSSAGDFGRLNPATGRIRPVNLFQTGELLAFVMAMLQDRQGNLWIGTGFAGLICYDYRRNRITRYRYDKNNPTQLSDAWARVLAEDRQGNIWIGTGYGLNRLNPKTGRFDHFFNDPKNPTSLAHNEIHSLCVTRSGQLWVGTDGGGLCLFHPANRQFTTFTDQDGLPDNAVQNILEDDDGNLWLNTNRGLCRFVPQTRQFTNFNLDNQAENVLISGNVSTGACYKADDGTLFFGGKNGFLYFHPRDLRFNPIKPPVVLTRVSLFDKPLPGSYDGQTLTLNHDQNSLTLEFSALNYTSAEKNQYAWQLDPFEPGRVFGGTRRSVTYTNLYPGTYTFRVKGSNNDGLWNETGTRMTLIIRPAWWQTVWFRVLVGLIVAGLAYAFYRYRLAQLRRDQTLRDQIARDLHDDVGGVLSGISFYSEAASAMHRQGRFDDSYVLLQKIADNARTTIDRMSDVVWSMRSDTGNAGRLSERLASFGRELLGGRNIRLLVETEPGLERLALPPDVLRNLYLIGKEALHNAAKHSDATEVQLRIGQTGGKINLTVQDNGRGFGIDAPESDDGNGLANMRKRAEAIGIGYSLTSSRGNGTVVAVG